MAIGNPPVPVPPKLAWRLRRLAGAPPRHSRISTTVAGPQSWAARGARRHLPEDIAAGNPV
jgi:hypothetical protein